MTGSTELAGSLRLERVEEEAGRCFVQLLDLCQERL